MSILEIYMDQFFFQKWISNLKLLLVVKIRYNGVYICLIAKNQFHITKFQKVTFIRSIIMVTQMYYQKLYLSPHMLKQMPLNILFKIFIIHLVSISRLYQQSLIFQAEKNCFLLTLARDRGLRTYGFPTNYMLHPLIYTHMYILQLQ